MNFPTKNLNIKYRILSAAGIFVLVLSAVIFLIFHSVNDIKSIKKEILAEQLSMEQKMFEDRNKAIIVKNLEKVEPLMGALDEIFIDKNRAIEFFTTIEDLAKKNNVAQKITLAEIAEEKNESYFLKTPISISCEGKFSDLAAFLKDLEKLSYYINIESLQIRKDRKINPIRTQNGDSLILEEPLVMDIQASTYWKF